VLRHCYCPLRIHTPYMTPNETRIMRAVAVVCMNLNMKAQCDASRVCVWCRIRAVAFVTLPTPF
jgi:hypothetical protein